MITSEEMQHEIRQKLLKAGLVDEILSKIRSEVVQKYLAMVDPDLHEQKPVNLIDREWIGSRQCINETDHA